jgi:hypothetical protein
MNDNINNEKIKNDIIYNLIEFFYYYYCYYINLFIFLHK